MELQSFALSAEELDAYQILVLNKNIDHHMIVTGCAGSGKSVLAIHKAKELKDQNYSFLFVVFTQALSSYMRAGIKQLNLNESNFSTYGKCFRKDDSKDEWVWGRSNYDFIIVDEAQDFSLEAVQELNRHCRYLYLFGDSAQSLYSRFFFDKNPTVPMTRFESWLGQRMDDLILNHRLPESIAKVAQYLNTEDDRLVGRCQKKGGNKPRIIKMGSFEEQCAEALRIIDNQGLQDVGILCFKKDEVQAAGDYFSNHEKTVDVFLGDKSAINFASSNPKIMTFKSSKGLQFQTVFMLNCDSSLGSSQMKDIYVAMTRSYQDLYIFYSGILCNLFSTVPLSLYETSIGGPTVQRRF